MEIKLKVKKVEDVPVTLARHFDRVNRKWAGPVGFPGEFPKSPKSAYIQGYKRALDDVVDTLILITVEIEEP